MKTNPLPIFRMDRPWRRMVLLGVALMFAPCMAAADEASHGERIYQQQCAKCHGESGEGTEKGYPIPLEGDLSVDQLAELITKTMPEGAPKKCVGEEADAVAAFIHDAFYSPIAQARNKPARIELSRLTVRQYRNSVTDLIGSFRGGANWDDQRGLKAEYFNSRGFRNNARVIERTDPVVHFDFKDSSPDPDKVDPHEFSIRWNGSILAPETGDYEFIIRTDHATRLWVNDNDTPLVDAWVKSGDDTEHRESIFLLGGRVYPIRLEFSKAKQGVDDKKSKERPPAPASISLEWVLPKRVAEVIPERYLSPNRSPEAFVAETPFPPDDRSIGYERGTSVSVAWDAATTDAAIEVADYVVDHLRELTGAREDAADREKRVKDFCRRFTERAFRRPLTDDLAAFFVDRQFNEASDLETAIKRSVLLTLKSPRFLYQEILDDGVDPYDVASRISFGLWDSLPDEALLKAAAEGQLSTREQVARQAERMVNDLRTKAKLREFFQQWLKVEQVPDIAKAPEAYPEFDEAVASDLRSSLDLFIDDVVWSDSSDFRQLLLAEDLYLNGRLAKVYGAGFARRRPIPEGYDGREGTRGGADPPVPDGGLRVHGDDLADPSRGVSHAECPGPGLASAARGLRAAGTGSAPGSDDERTCRPANQPRNVHEVPRDDQPAGVHARKLRRDRALPDRGKRTGHRRNRLV